MMKNKLVRYFIFMLMLGSTLTSLSYAQTTPIASPREAFLKSLVLPGWGHQGVQQSWKGKASIFTGADLTLWLGLLSTNWRESHYIQSYEVLAITQGNALIEGKDRTFFINMANYASSQAYIDALIRGRQWQRLEEAEKPENYWQWENDSDKALFSQTRNQAESMRRQRPILISLLVANRLLAAISATQAARKERGLLENVSISLSPQPQEKSPLVNISISW